VIKSIKRGIRSEGLKVSKSKKHPPYGQTGVTREKGEPTSTHNLFLCILPTLGRVSANPKSTSHVRVFVWERDGGSEELKASFTN
jgi:hypothetical protein